MQEVLCWASAAGRSARIAVPAGQAPFLQGSMVHKKAARSQAYAQPCLLLSALTSAEIPLLPLRDDNLPLSLKWRAESFAK